VNIEMDVLAKHVERLVAGSASGRRTGSEERGWFSRWRR
jgi:riboflavin synthase alpha subunit